MLLTVEHIGHKMVTVTAPLLLYCPPRASPPFPLSPLQVPLVSSTPNHDARAHNRLARSFTKRYVTTI